MTITGGGLLARMEALVDLAVARHGLALGPDGSLTGSARRAVAEAAGLALPADAGSAEFLVTLAQAVGLLRVSGGRVRATNLRRAWASVSPDLRAGLVYAAWCHRVRWDQALGGGDGHALAAGRVGVLQLLLRLPLGAEVDVPGLAGAVGRCLAPPSAGRGQEDRIGRAFVAVFLDPLASLGAAELEPPPPAPPRYLRLGPAARAVIGAALLAAAPLAAGG